ncbi:MAG: hypothetical protein ABSG53_14685 [Thermoguttaceae bacterium]|jgi:hypothetical protein
MYLILNAHSSNEHYNAGCDYAVVDLTPALAEQIRSRVALARKARQKDADLWELYFWGGTPDFHDHAILDACQDAAAASGLDPDNADCDWLTEFELQEYAVVPMGVDLNVHERQRTECDQMIIQISPSPLRREFSIIWTASPKYADLDVTTAELPLTAMEELLATALRPVT